LLASISLPGYCRPPLNHNDLLTVKMIKTAMSLNIK